MSKISNYGYKVLRNEILSVQVNLLNKCPSRCKSCQKYTWNQDDEIPLDDLLKTIYTLKSVFGLESICFSGGEPLMYKHFGELIEYCDLMGVKFSLITTLISKNEDLIKKVGQKASRIHVSIDSSSKEKYKDIRGVDGLDIVKDNINILRDLASNGKLNSEVRVSATISSLNYDEVFNLYKYAKANGCLINFYMVHTFEDLYLTEEHKERTYSDLKKVVEDEAKCGAFISNASSLIKNQSVKTPNVLCQIPKIHALINANGDIYPCCKLLGDNDFYGKNVKNAYGNILNKTKGELIAELNKRLKCNYWVDCEACDGCTDRYKEVVGELFDMIYASKKPISNGLFL